MPLQLYTRHRVLTHSPLPPTNHERRSPEGSITGRQRECGGTDRYCPWGSAEPTPVKEGWYTIGGGTGGGLQGRQGDGDFAFIAQPTQTRTDEVECPIGHFCVKGIKKPCPAGR